METKECYVDLHPVAKDRVVARTKASLTYLAHTIETARESAERTLYNEFGLTRKDVEDLGIYNKKATQEFIRKIHKLSTYPIRDGVLETLTEINAVCVNGRVFSDVNMDTKIGNEDAFEASMWARDALYALCSKIRLYALQFLAESYWDITVESYLVGKNDIYWSNGKKID